ncbi:MAG: helix-turn-helix domain-containing protein [Candidatus Saccharimonadales bacterium]
MSQDTEVLRAYFAKLNLEPEIADLYLALHAYGAQTISDLARNSGVERTRIYRVLDDMVRVNLVEVETHYKRSIIRPAPVSNLQILLSKKEEELRDLQKHLADVQNSLQQHNLRSPGTSVQFYKGIEGLKQMFWNQTKGTKENFSILYENTQGRTNSSFFERWVRECNRRELTFNSIVGDHFIETQKQWYAKKDNERLAIFESRYVTDDIFRIDHSTVLYDDVVSYFNWHDGNVFGVEIHNPEIALAQRQFFAMLWEKAAPLSKSVSQQLPNDYRPL